MEEESASSARESSVLPPIGTGRDLAARARFEREAASLDLSDAEQAAERSDGKADGLYASADRHRLLAERLEAGDASALVEFEATD